MHAFVARETTFVTNESAIPYAIFATVLEVAGETTTASYFLNANLPVFGKLEPCSFSVNISSM